jgi:type IV pilus assembly protein PilB
MIINNGRLKLKKNSKLKDGSKSLRLEFKNIKNYFSTAPSLGAVFLQVDVEKGGIIFRNEKRGDFVENSASIVGKSLAQNVLTSEKQNMEDAEYIEKARVLRVPFMDLSSLKIDPEIAQLIPEAMARRCRVLCIGKVDKKLTLAMEDPNDVFAIDDVRLRTNMEVMPVLVKPDALENAFKLAYGGAAAFQEVMKEAMEDASQSMDLVKETAEEEKEIVIDTPIIKMVNQIIYKAVESRASDIHIEPFENDVIVRYRIDGVLHTVMNPPKSLLPAIVSRIKIMSNLKIDEKRVPQDGRIHMLVKEQNRDLDIRVSTLPTLYGESVVMRLLDRQSMKVDLNTLGFEPAMLEAWKALASHPHGMIFVTGPTGSGKSTTIYATLNLLNSPEDKIITIEDPVEYYLKGVNQVQVNPKVGLNFATGLRAFLRQDPDIMMVGEIRDKETAAIAIEAALTGHLVLSTLHTNTSIGAITRLVDMGVEPYLISATILGVLAQRLVRLICSKCKEPVKEIPPALADLFAKNGIKEYTLFRGKGCSDCAETGYRGRKAIYELFVPTAQIKSLISKGASEDVIEKEAVASGFATLFQDGLKKVAAGLTTYEELCRATIKESA